MLYPTHTAICVFELKQLRHVSREACLPSLRQDAFPSVPIHNEPHVTCSMMFNDELWELLVPFESNWYSTSQAFAKPCQFMEPGLTSLVAVSEIKTTGRVATLPISHSSENQ